MEVFTMFQYFMYRARRKKTIYISIVTGSILSLLYVIINVLPYRAYEYYQSPYTLWIECFTSSIFAELLFFIAPILAALGMSDILFSDKASGYFDLIKSKGKGLSYFITLFLTNFIIGAVCFMVPILINIYCCFCLLPDLTVDPIVGESTVVSLYGTDTLFPELYYAHPLLHMFLYTFLGGLVAGIFATIGLVAGFFVKKQLFVWLAPFIVNYVYMTLVVLLSPGNAAKYLPVNYMRQVSGGGDFTAMLIVLGTTFCISIGSYMWGVKKNVYC